METANIFGYCMWSCVWSFGFPDGSALGDQDSIPGLGRSPGKGNNKPTPVVLPGDLHGQRNLAVHGVAKSWTQRSD